MWNRFFFLLGVLAAILIIYKISSYEPEIEQQEITVEHVREGIKLAEEAVTKVEEYFLDVHHFPVDNKEAGIAFPNQIKSENVKSVAVYGGRVIVTFRKHLMQGASFTLKPDFSKTQPIKVEWRCETGKINRSFFEEIMPECMVTDSDLMEKLRKAVYQSDIKMIEIALDEGAKINAILHGESPLSMAITNGKVNIVEYLLENGADIEQVAPRYGSQTPLMVSLTYGNADIVKLLIERGADVNAKDDKGKTVLQHVRHSREQYRKLLIDAGAEEIE